MSTPRGAPPAEPQAPASPRGVFVLDLGGKIALSIALALALSAAAWEALVPLIERGARDEVASRVMGQGLLWAQQQVARTPRAERPRLVEEIAATLSHPLWIEPRTVAEARRGGEALSGPSLAGPPHHTLLLMPLDADEVLVAGPVLPTPSARARLGLPLFVLGSAALVAFVGVAVPIRRRLRRLEQAARSLASGDLGVRVEDPSRDVIGTVGASFDRMAEALERSLFEREQLLQAVSHELGTPLARMRFYVEALEGARDDDVRHRRLADLDRALIEVDRLSVELASWVELDARRGRGETVDLGALVREVVADAGLDAGEAVTVRAQLPEAVALEVHGDTRQLHRALGNVVRNAMRYARSQVVVEGRAEGDGVRLEVRDDGPGVPVEHRERVFQPFTRVEASRSRSSGGMGLGLAIVSRIVRTHGGWTRIEDAPEGGASVVTWWPREQR